MTNSEIKLLLLIHLKGPQNVEQIQGYITLELVAKDYVYWMPTDRGRTALTLTRKGEEWVKEAMRVLGENCDCLGS